MTEQKHLYNMHFIYFYINMTRMMYYISVIRCWCLVNTIADKANKSRQGQFTHRRHDTTRQHATRPVFSLPIQSSGSVQTCSMTMSGRHDKKLRQ